MKRLPIMTVAILTACSVFTRADIEPIQAMEKIVARSQLVISGVITGIHETSVEEIKGAGASVQAHELS